MHHPPPATVPLVDTKEIAAAFKRWKDFELYPAGFLPWAIYELKDAYDDARGKLKTPRPQLHPARNQDLWDTLRADKNNQDGSYWVKVQENKKRLMTNESAGNLA